MKVTYVVRESATLVFTEEGKSFEARALTDAKRRAIRKQMYEGSNLRLEYENGDVVSIKRSGFKWEDKL
jgi:hypothetical protein